MQAKAAIFKSKIQDFLTGNKLQNVSVTADIMNASIAVSTSSEAGLFPFAHVSFFSLILYHHVNNVSHRLGLNHFSGTINC